jgi:hypothetical protein
MMVITMGTQQDDDDDDGGGDGDEIMLNFNGVFLLCTQSQDMVYGNFFPDFAGAFAGLLAKTHPSIW